MINEALRQLRAKNRLLQQILATLLKSPQRRNQVSAIHRRHELRRQWPKRASVIPVIKVAAVAAHATHGGQSLSGQLREFRHREISKLAGDLAGVEQKSDVRWRDPPSHAIRFFLHVVRDQPVVFLGAEFGEVAPGADRRAVQEKLIFLRSFSLRGSRWKIEP